MAENKGHFWRIMLFYFRKGNASQTQMEICAVYNESAVDNSTCCNNARSGRPAKTDGNEILTLIESDRHSAREIPIEKIPSVKQH